MSGLINVTGARSGVIGTTSAPVAAAIVKVTSFTIPEYNVACNAAEQNKTNFVQIGDHPGGTMESWDVVLEEANSKILIQMYFIWGGWAGHGYFDMKRGGTGGTFLAGTAFTKTGLVATLVDTETDFETMSLSYLDNPGPNAAGTTLTYVPYVGQDGGGEETIDINNRQENAYQDMTSQVNFLEIAV
jgi:hypothetical protein